MTVKHYMIASLLLETILMWPSLHLLAEWTGWTMAGEALETGEMVLEVEEGSGEDEVVEVGAGAEIDRIEEMLEIETDSNKTETVQHNIAF